VADSRQNRVRRHGLGGGWIVIRALSSLAAGAAVWVVTQKVVPLDSDAATNNALSIGVSVFVGGLLLVLESIAGLEHLVKRLPKEVQAAAQVYGIIEKSDFRTEDILRFLNHAASVRADPPLVFDFARREIERLSTYLNHLGQKTPVLYRGEDRDWLLGLANVAKISIDATSLTTVDTGGEGQVDHGLWGSELGHRYLAAQRDAVTVRDVEIRRIFILNSPGLTEDDDKFLDVLRKHHEAGVEVWVIDKQTADQHRVDVKDFIVIDGVLVYHSEHGFNAGPGYPVIDETRLITSPDDVKNDIERYRRLLTMAKRFVPAPATPHR
jgi:hypothetical protein